MVGIKLGIVASILASTISGGKSNINNVGLYPETAVVTEVNKDLVTVECFNGNVFQFYDSNEDWIKGDLASMIMCDNGTQKVKDDIIVNAKYSGWVNEWGYGNNKIYFKK